MSAQDRVRWDGIYRRLNRKPYPKPDSLLLDYTQPVTTERRPPHRALDLAGGYGQNGLWLATQGYTVDIMDISRVALTRARAEMTIRNLRRVNLLQADLDDLDLGEDYYSVVCMFRYLRRDFHRKLKASVERGGRIIYESHNRHYLEIVPDFNPDFLLEPGELQAIFFGWHILHEADIDHISQIVAVKPDNN